MAKSIQKQIQKQIALVVSFIDAAYNGIDY
jgi:hypothetical protein